MSAKKQTGDLPAQTTESALHPLPAEQLLELSRQLAAIESLDELVKTLIEMISWEVGAERATLFLNDPKTGELYSRYAQGHHHREIRILNDSGIAGHVFTSGEAEIINDAYADPRFNPTVDEQTGFHTRNLCCTPVHTVRGEVIGVVQVLNKKDGGFTEADLAMVGEITTQAAITLQSSQFVERVRLERQRELEFMDVLADVTTDLELSSLLGKVMAQATRMLQAERSTLFLNDEKSRELFSRILQGNEVGEIRFPNHLGIAGTVFTSGKTLNIPHAYADLRFNPSFDKQTGFFTRSILCVPITNKQGKVIGVTQVLNKRGGPFTDEDEQRLKAFTSQIAIALENAKLFEDVQNMKNYNESVLESMSAAVLTADEDGVLVTCNNAGHHILDGLDEPMLGAPVEEVFVAHNAWLAEKVRAVYEREHSEISMDQTMQVGDQTISVNATVHPLFNAEHKRLGAIVMLEDISNEKRLKSTMSRYMDAGLADQLLATGSELLGGASIEATVMFSDIRSFTTLSEELGPQGTVSLLNDYFTLMVDCIQQQGGMLDKFIGDAIMAVFGVPVSHADDTDRAVLAAIAMMRELERWNLARAGRGAKPVNIGIGLNTGQVVSGNIGSPKRMDYTIIGDNVNLASRLEGACKQYGTRILISEYTRAQLHGVYRLRPVDRVIVKGKTEPVEIFEVLDYHTDESFPNMMDTIEYFREGRRRYEQREWDGAVEAFRRALTARPGDRLSELYIERCDYFRTNPPPEQWDGVWTMTSK